MAAESGRCPHAGSGRGASEQGSSRILALCCHAARGRGPRGKTGHRGRQLDNPSVAHRRTLRCERTPPDRGVKALNEFLLPDHRQRVEEAASLTNLPLEEAARFPLRLARIMRECGPTICEQWEAAYPRAMEEAVLRYLNQELRSLGLADMLNELG